ncbi:MAG: ribosome maturation factor RimM [Melioribacteraceae bacterium]|nr:MAG: ribosome maturation factor RimM [Melioribacteraceae bacterium]
MNDLVLIGEIKAVDDDGWLSIFSYSDFPDRFKELKSVFIEVFGVTKSFYIENVELNGSKILLKFRNFDTFEDAEFLNGRKLLIHSAEMIELPDDQFFIHDLIGSEVFRNDKLLGVIDDVLSTPANDVLVIHGNDDELLIPVVKDFIDRFDAFNKKMILKPGEDNIYDDED